MNTLPPESEPKTPKETPSLETQAPAKLCFRLPRRTPSVLRQPVGAGFILAIVVGVILLRGWLIEGVIVDGDSMHPTLHNGQRLLVLQKHYNSDRLPRRGDIVVLRDPQAETAVVKRVIALPGEELIMNGTQVLINNELLNEPFAHGKNATYLMGRLPPGTIWVLGDNRDNSADSRIYGPVPLSDIRGRTIFSLWPPKAIPQRAKLE